MNISGTMSITQAVSEYRPENQKTAESFEFEQQLRETKPEVIEEAKTAEVNTMDTPAAEMILSTQMINRIRTLSQTALSNRTARSEDSEGNVSQVTDIIAKLAALSAKLSGNEVTSGERTYIQTEINYLQRNIVSTETFI